MPYDAYPPVGAAKGLRSSMVRSQSRTCGSTNGPFFNTKTGGGIPACSPVVPPESNGGPATSYSFGDKGVDLPMRFAFPNPSNGGLSLVGDSAEELTRITGATSAALPTCSQTKILAVTLETPDGQRFAEIGMGTR